ncbi:MAG: hypothetical protein K8R23_15340 [Chthoniobacter sp.]|nr:hypothetical protein [Chthoniobacter sp.]
MTGYSPDEDRQPFTYFRGHPIYAATLLVIIHVITMVATTLLTAARAGGILQALTFSSSDVIHHLALWQCGTYAFVNAPSVGFAIGMAMLYLFGRQVEGFIGRRAFLLMYLLLLVLTPLVLSLVGLVQPTAFSGSGSLHFAVFIAFATIYPGAAIFFGIQARWIALILVAIYSLQDLMAHDWTDLLTLWVNIGFAWAFIHHERGHFALPDLRFWKKKPHFRVVRAEPLRESESAAPSDMDALLDKIAKSGLASLTAKERARLEAGRAELLKKDRR